MTEMHELTHIMETLMSEILKGHLGIEQTPLYDIAQNTRYDYYHSDQDKQVIIRPAKEIENLDPSFTKTLINSETYLFPEFGPFFKGCVSLSTST